MNHAWKTLSGVHVNDDKEHKGRFDYLTWAHSWKHGPHHVAVATTDAVEDT